MRLPSWLRSARSRFVDDSKQARRPAQLPKRAVPTRLSVEHMEDRTVPATFTVHNLADAGAGSLRAAVVAANANPGADVIAFTPSLQGTVALTSGELGVTDDLRVDGPGAGRLAVSGSDLSRVFHIGSGATVSIDGLTITRGRGDRQGGGILNLGNLTLSHAVVSHNEAVGLPGATPDVDAMGGGLLSRGALVVSHTLFVGNRSTGGDGNPGGTGSTALGGAIMSRGFAGVPATASISHCTFLDNRAVGGAAGAGFPFTRSGLGGAVMNGESSMTISYSRFDGNRAVGGAGGGFPGGIGAGGAIANGALVGAATLSVSHCTLTNNRAIGGTAAPGTAPQVGKGGGIANFIPGPASLGATATASVADSVILGNRAVGGSGPTGGTGQGGGITNENGASLTVSNSLIALNRAIGGAGTSGNGGNGLGGGIFNGGSSPFGTSKLTIEGSIVALNRADGGESDGGSDGLGQGGGLYLAPGGIATADLTAIFANFASTSDDDVFGILV